MPMNNNAPPHSFGEKLRFLKPFWVSDQKWQARAMLGGILALTVAEIALSAGIGLGFQAAINALVAKNALTFATSGAATVGGLLATNVAANQRQYMTDTLTLDWRGWLTQQFNAAWLKNGTHYKLQQKHKGRDPDQRIAENIPAVADQTLGLGLGAFRSVLSLATFAVMLWHLSPLMLGAAVVCALGASAMTRKIGGPFESLTKRLQACEAKFRHTLVRVKDNAKTIAQERLEPTEEKSLNQDFNGIDAGRRELYKLNRKIGMFTTLNLQSSTVVPIALAAPQFFFGSATMGSLELMRQVYGQVYGALSWYPQSYPLVATWSTNTDQLIDLSKAIAENKADVTEQSPFAVKPALPARGIYRPRLSRAL